MSSLQSSDIHEDLPKSNNFSLTYNKEVVDVLNQKLKYYHEGFLQIKKKAFGIFKKGKIQELILEKK